jgi:nitrite reductase/ring-hydroxylating ferredoxin subunit
MTHPEPTCSGCESEGRRAFLREAMAVAAAALAGLGLSPRLVAALPVRAGTGRRHAGSAELSYPIPAEDGVTIDRENQVILVRSQHAMYAFALSCPHQNTALRWLDEDHIFQCPKHKSRYQPDGTFISGRATRNMDRLPIRGDGKQVLVDPDRVFESDRDGAGWAAAQVKV